MKPGYNRRNFMQVAGALAAGSLILPQWACGSSGNTSSSVSTQESEPSPSLSAYGIQLYTLRDLLPSDPKGYISQLAPMGYTQIEGYEGPQGMFWNMPHTEFKSFLDDNGLTMVASHCEIKENFEEKAAQAAEIGMSYLICPWIGAQKSLDEWKKIADLFNECGEICRKNGIRFAYHNHEYTFEELEGVIPQDYLMENTDPEVVDFELDIYWVVTGKADPIAYFEKYPNRFRLCHVKDRLKTAGPDEREASCVVGTGSIDFPKILNVASKNGMEYYILEQERYDNSTPIDSAKAGAEYLKELVFA